MTNCARAAVCLMLAWNAACAAASVQMAGALTNFSDPNSAALQAAFSAEGKPFRWVQFGDSHTAGEYFTGELRTQLQKRFGDAGPGWFFPGYVRQQRFDLAKLSNAPGWELTASRASSAAGFAAGGVEATAVKAGASFSVQFKQPLPAGKYAFKALLLPQIHNQNQNQNLSPNQAESAMPLLHISTAGQDQPLRADANAAPQSWQVLHSQHHNPSADWTIASAQAHSLKLAGFWLDLEPQEGKKTAGASVDALGLNGALAETASKWDAASLAAWLQERQPTVVVFEYGTNEALDPQFSSGKFSAALTELIQAVRRNSSAAVVLISPPDLYMAPKRAVRQTVKLANGKKKTVVKNVKLKVACDVALPVSYQTVHAALRAVAVKEKTLYWDWQAAMGGRCAMRAGAQASPPLAQPDGVHMTAEGYATYAKLLWADLLKLEGQKP